MKKWAPDGPPNMDFVVERGNGYLIGVSYLISGYAPEPLELHIWKITPESINATIEWRGRVLPGATIYRLRSFEGLEQIEVERLIIDSSVLTDDEALPLNPMVSSLYADGRTIAGVKRLSQGHGLTRLECSWPHLPHGANWLKELTRLETWKVASADLTWLTDFEGLTSLSMEIAGKLENFTGIEAAERLRHLRIKNPFRVTDPTPLTLLTHLTELELEGLRKVTNLEFLRKMPQLRLLKINSSGHFDSAAPLAALTGLEVFYAWGSTIFDAPDVSVITENSKLRTLGIENRPHYTPRLSSFIAEDEPEDNLDES